MFTMKQSLATAGVVATIGTTIVLGTIVNTSPATAALLDFNFFTINGATGSFTLNTSTPDSNPTGGAGLFQNAITNLEYSLFGISEPGPLDVRTFFNGPQVVIFDILDNPASPGSGSFDLYLDYENPDQLSDDPDDYFISQTGSFAGYGGFIQAPNNGSGQAPFSRVVGLTVSQQTEPTPVPEASSVAGLMGLAGLGLLKKRK